MNTVTVRLVVVALVNAARTAPNPTILHDAFTGWLRRCDRMTGMATRHLDPIARSRSCGDAVALCDHNLV